MDKAPQNKKITIIGNAGGTTRQIAENFLNRGAELVIICDANEIWGKETVELLNNKFGAEKAVFVVYEITSDLQVVAFATYQKYGGFDVLVLNFGIIDESDRRKAVDFNLYWPIEHALKYWRYVRKDKEGQKGGTIFFMSSSCAFKENYFLPNYQATTLALIGFTKSLGHAYNYNRTGVRVIHLCPGFTEREMYLNPKVMCSEPSGIYQNDFDSYLERQVVQKEDTVGKAVVEVFEKAESGTTWVIDDEKIKEYHVKES